MRAIDTNVLVRLIAQDDPKQAETASNFIADGAWVPAIALAEAVWVLGTVYGLGPGELAQVIEMVLNHRELVLQDADVIQAALKLFRAQPGLGFSDCLILEQARRAGHLPMGTFDRKLAKAPGAERL